MGVKAKLENGDVVKTVNEENVEQSSVDGNVFTITKYGYAASDKDKETLLSATASRTIITRSEIDALVATVGDKIGSVDTEQVCLTYNQVQREDATNSARAEIRGDSVSPEMSKAKRLAKLIEKMTPAEAKDYLDIAESQGYSEQLQECLGDRYEEIINA